MGMSISSSVAAMNAHRALSTTDDAMSTSMGRLSSGYRINKASDDAAGLAISEGLRSQIGGMTQAVRNTQDGTSVVQTAEGALNETTSILQRMRDLAVQASNDGSLNDDAKSSIQKEMDQLKSELTRLSDTTTFDGTKLLDGSYTGKAFQIGANAGETITVDIAQGAGARALGVNGVDVTLGPFTASVTTLPGYSPEVPGTPSGPGVPGTPTIPEEKVAGVITAGGDFTADRAAWSNLSGTIGYGTTGRLDLSTVQGTHGAVPTLVDVQAALDATFGAAAVTAAVDSAGTLTFTGGSPSSVGDLADMTLQFTAATNPPPGAFRAISRIDDAMGLVSARRADLGALENRFEHAIDNLALSIENTSASEARIRDTDMATEMSRFTRSQVRTSAGTSMLAQANQSTQSILELLS